MEFFLGLFTMNLTCFIYSPVGTDEKAIIEVIRSHSNEQRQQIKTMFKTMYGKVGQGHSLLQNLLVHASPLPSTEFSVTEPFLQNSLLLDVKNTASI